MFFKNGGAMGFTPSQIKEMSVWEFCMTVEGFRLANGGDEASKGEGKSTPMTEERFMALVDKLADQPKDWDEEV